MKVVFRPEARVDLTGIRAWIARDNPARALTFVRELRERALALTEYPLRHPVFQESEAGAIHKLTHGRYLLFYRVLTERVEVLHLRHSAMDEPSFD